MVDSIYFFDSYALIEVFKGNKNYQPYAQCNVITSYLHVFEVYFNLLKEYDEKIIEPFFARLRGFCVELDFNWIKGACAFRKMYLKRDLSYADCLGYIIAKSKKIKFLTGDRVFEKLDNVEFVTK